MGFEQYIALWGIKTITAEVYWNI